MPSFKITLAYDGTDFVGWQRQANGVSIQGLLEDALAKLDGRAVAVAGAGRTDSGVHALGQVAAFTLERAHAGATRSFARSTRTCPTRSASRRRTRSPASFHPRFDARSKTYRYRIWNADVVSPFERRYAWHVPGALDVDGDERRGAAARRASTISPRFRPPGATSPRRCATSWHRGLRIADCGLIADSASATWPAYPSPQSAISIRNPQSAIRITRLRSDRQRFSPPHGPDDCRHAGGDRPRTPAGGLDGATCSCSRDRAHAGPTAPAAGLFLVSVDYGPVCSWVLKPCTLAVYFEGSLNVA